jgi:HAD superfamily hydrolase (TIGR01509 family)
MLVPSHQQAMRHGGDEGAIDMSTDLPSPAVKALIFDMDGLLVDSEPLTDIALAALLQQHGCVIDWSDKALAARLMGSRMPEILAVVSELCGITTPAAELNEALEALRLQTLRGQLRAMPGAVELLAFASACGLPLALATSGRRTYVDAVLAETRLTGCFAVEVTGEDVTRGKPDPATYLLAASRLGADPATCVVLEDAPNGIAAAAAAGMRSIAVPNVYSRDLPFVPPPELVLPDLHAVIPWLQHQGHSDQDCTQCEPSR